MTTKDFRTVDAASANARDAVRSAKDQVASETSHVLHDAARHADQAGVEAGGAASDLADRAKGAMRDLSARLPDDAVASGKRAYAEGSATVGRRVAQHPLEALLLAGALGYLVGWATAR